MLNLRGQIRCPQNPYTDYKSALDQPLNTHFNFHTWLDLMTHSFLQGENPPFLREPSLSGHPPFSEANLKNYPPLSDSHPNWCMKIVWTILKWRTYISYYTTLIENIINITLYTFRLNSVFTTDSLVTYCLWCFSYLICKRIEHETFLITILLNLMCL